MTTFYDHINTDECTTQALEMSFEVVPKQYVSCCIFLHRVKQDLPEPEDLKEHKDPAESLVSPDLQDLLDSL